MDDHIYLELLSNVQKLLEEPTFKKLKESYRAPVECPFLSDEAKKKIADKNTTYEQNLVLRKEVSKIMKGKFNVKDYDLAFWIINTWGGIPQFRKNDTNKERLRRFFDDLKEGHTSLDRISSLSKVASFAYPSKYFVYDSRVAYSLDWLLLKSGARDGFFRKPAGRNTRLNRFNIHRIIENKIGKGDHFVNACQTYAAYNNLILKLFMDLRKNKKLRYPFEVEMLLFLAAPLNIFEEIQQVYSETDLDESKNDSGQKKGSDPDGENASSECKTEITSSVPQNKNIIYLKVYDGNRHGNYGITFQILKNSRTLPHDDARYVAVEYKNRRYAAALRTYQHGDTLRGAGTIMPLITENGWQPGKELKSEFIRSDDSHIYRILDEQEQENEG